MVSDRATVGRRGFTLVEMLVVMAIILALAAITLAFLPTALDKDRVTRGTGNLQSWLGIAKQWAARDNAPRGIRLQRVSVDSGTSTVTATSPTTTTITPSAMTGFAANGAPWSIVAGMTLQVSDPDGSKSEFVTVSNPTATTFDATFALTHTTASFPIRLPYVAQCQYIEQPDDWHQNVSVSFTFTAPPPPTDNTAAYTITAISPPTPDPFCGGFPGPSSGSPQPDAWPVQPGDYFQDTDTKHVYRITANGGGTLAVIGSASNWLDPNTAHWAVVRAPRVRAGEGILTLPQNVAIDLGTNVAYGNAIPGTNNLDILFRPDGSVYYWAGSGDKIQLWLRDLSEDAPATTANPLAVFNGEQALLTVYIRSGLIASNTVDTTLNTTVSPNVYTDPYYFTRDGRGSGL